MKKVRFPASFSAIDMGAEELSPPHVLRIFRQFGFTDGEIEEMLK